MIAFAGGKRISLDTEARTVTVHGRLHIDSYPFDKAPSRVRLYRGLAKKRPADYADSLTAAEKAVAMVAKVESHRHA